MTISRMLAISLVSTLMACDYAEKEVAPSATDDTFSSYPEPNYGDAIRISTTFRSQEEESSVEFCSSPLIKDAPSCIGESERCWVVFDDSANDDLDHLVTTPHFIDYGLYWMEGVGRKAVSEESYGHTGKYPCQIKMMKVDHLDLIADGHNVNN